VAFTFGATTATRITGNVTGSFSAANTDNLVCGWFYPTTLTAARGYWSLGATLSVATTTSELSFLVAGTTSQTYTTSGAGIAINNWYFIAVLWSNTSLATNVRIWLGTVDTAPIELTLTPSGTLNTPTPSTSIVIGNTGAGTAALQGSIDYISGIVSTGAALTGPTNILGISAHGVITQEEANYVLERFVRPLWLNNHLTAWGPVPGSYVSAGTSICIFIDLNIPLPVVKFINYLNANSISPLITTVASATLAQIRVGKYMEVPTNPYNPYKRH